jgi:hypothetical protein
MAQDDPESFSAQTLTRSDTLYFTVTVFATVGLAISPPRVRSRQGAVRGKDLELKRQTPVIDG